MSDDDRMAELEQVAVERTLNGQRCVAVKFASAGSCQIVDLNSDGEASTSYSVPLGPPDLESSPAA